MTFERNYLAVKNRGLITSETTKQDFIEKIKEEFGEFEDEVTTGLHMTDSEAEELADFVNAACNLLIFSGRNPEIELEKVAIKNENRANEHRKSNQ